VPEHLARFDHACRDRSLRPWAGQGMCG
jgi:hypothetical protein